MNKDQEGAIAAAVEAAGRAAEAPESETPPMTIAEFFESVPPNTPTTIPGLYTIVRKGTPPLLTFTYRLDLPSILIHCTNDICNGPRVHRAVGEANLLFGPELFSYQFVDYLCSNCRAHRKTYALRLLAFPAKPQGMITKLGEHPPYGPVTPTRLLKLLGDERETFLSGRRCENQGLGIGAFGYYRRVVENQKNRIIDEIIKASSTLHAKQDALDLLERAKNETQFSSSVALVKEAIPQALLIKGHNPLNLLHAALSEGLHAGSDQECLAIAHDIRVVLAELAERLSEVMKDQAELNTAVSRLLKPRPAPTP